jgi:hypothetical protein
MPEPLPELLGQAWRAVGLGAAAAAAARAAASAPPCGPTDGSVLAMAGSGMDPSGLSEAGVVEGMRRLPRGVAVDGPGGLATSAAVVLLATEAALRLERDMAAAEAADGLGALPWAPLRSPPTASAA